MDVISSPQKSVLRDVDRLNDLQPSLKEVDGFLVNDLDGSFKKALSIEDAQNSECEPYVNYVDDSNDRNEQGELELPHSNFSKKCLSKSATFPIPAVMSPPNVPGNDEEKPEEKPEIVTGDMSSKESMHQAFTRSISLPAPVKLVSAMKGSRAQHYGVSPKLTVKWAPDVYDPPQTSLSHSVKNKKQQKSKNRKNGKKGQKGSNSSRGSGSRDKRQARKVVGSSDRHQRTFDSHESLVNSLNEFERFDDGSPDSHCGSIFLKTSVTKVHYSVTEAL